MNTADAALRASRRAAAVVDRRMRRGLTSLATIASIAPWFGFLGAVLGIFNSFPGFGTEKSTALGIVAQRLSDALMPAAFGILIAITATWFYKYLTRAAATIAVEMESAALALALQLARHDRRWPS